MSPATEEQGTLRCSAVGKVWLQGTQRAVAALDDVDLEVAPGEFVVLIGPSGCGKSTLLSLVAGLEDVTSGTIEHAGGPVGPPGPDRCMIFQQASLFPWLSVADNVTFGPRLNGMPKSERRELATRLLRSVGLAHAVDQRPGELSGGMRQRVAIARALAMEPEVLLMDEPFAALDVQTRSKLQDHVIEVWRQSGASVLFVTHHIDEAIALADRIVVFTAAPGRIKEIVPVALPRPRNPRDAAVHEIHDHLLDLLRDEVDRAFAAQEGLGV
ncbi:MAG: ABC transporter ATP-binding protein [Solirubrobacteraceae bacterium]